MPMKSDACVSSESLLPLPQKVREAAERVSFCIDAPELWAQDDAELDALLADTASGPHTCQTWRDYHWLGDVLRHGEGALPPADAAFVAAVMRRVVQEPLPQTAPLPLVHAVGGVQREAANNAVFRWKWVAGVAALAAVVSVAWQVLVASGGGAAGPQLAQAPTHALPAAPVPVWTEHGVVLRDPQLEALLNAHRQFGGASALQMPAGFLRNATYDAPQR